MCIRYRAADGTLQTIVHHKIEDFNKNMSLRSSALLFKEETINVSYREREIIPEKNENLQQTACMVQQFEQLNTVMMMYTPYGLIPVQY